MAGGGSGIPVFRNVFEARLRTDISGAGTTGTLTLLPYAGNRIEVNGLMVPVPALGMTRLVTDNLINAAGGDSGAPGAANTLYYVYVSNPAATFSPSSIRLSATAPSLVNGVRYLGLAGNALNWRFVGWVRLNATPNFESSQANRLIVNYYNRERLTLFTCPAYVDDNLSNSYTFNSTTWLALNAGVGSRVSYIANGEDAQSFDCSYRMAVAASQATGGLGVDSVTTSKFCAFSAVSPPDSNLSGSYAEIGAEGYHTADLLGLCVPAAVVTVFADDLRRGGTSDPFATYLTGTVLG
jgi:hypothetical protein